MADTLAAWVAELAAALEIDAAALDRDLVLDVARDAAHGVARPAAPLTTFLVGYAAGVRGGTPEDVAAAAATAQRLAAEHADQPRSDQRRSDQASSDQPSSDQPNSDQPNSDQLTRDSPA